MTKRIGPLVLWSVLGGMLLVAAYLLVNTTFMFYDDEGYVLSTYRAFLSGQRLYDDVFTQYGPWPYLYHQLVTLVLQAPLTHMLGRSLTIIHWVGCALLCGLMARRLSGRTWVAVSATLTAFGLLWQMCSEPSHPGSLISLLVAVAGTLALQLPYSARPARIGAALGAVAALLFLTKINVGLLLVTGLGAIALRFTAWPPGWRRPAAGAATLGLMAVAWVLMLQKLGEPWPRVFALQFTVAAAGLVWVTPAAWFEPPLPPRTWTGAAAGFLVTVLLVCGAVCVQGTSWRALFEAVVISPVKQPARFMFGFTWVPAVWPVAAGCWLLAARAGWELRRKGDLTAVTRYLLAAVRLGALAMFIAHAEQWLTILGVGRFIVFCLPLAPVFVIPLGVRAAVDPRRRAAGWLLGFVALPQVLHAFPVAGSQMGWGTFLLVPLFVAGIDEALDTVTNFSPSGGRRIVAACWSLVLAVNAWQWWLLANEGWERYTTSRPLGLPGAEDIRLQGAARQTLRLLTLNAAVHTDMLFSRPGMFSYNIWSGARTPTTRNATHWFWLLSAAEQEQIVAQLEKTPRRGIITNARLDQFMNEINIPMAGPLQSHLLAGGYRTLFEHDDFHFLVPVASRAVPFGVIEHLVDPNPGPDGRQAVEFRANIVLDGRPDHVALERLDYPWATVQDYRGKGSQVFLEPITSNGATLGPPVALPATHELRGLFRMTVLHDSDPQLARPHDVGLMVRDAAGRAIAEAVF